MTPNRATDSYKAACAGAAIGFLLTHHKRLVRHPSLPAIIAKARESIATYGNAALPLWLTKKDKAELGALLAQA